MNDKRLNWIGKNKIDLEPNERFAFLAKTVYSQMVGAIPKGSLVIHRYKDNSIKIRDGGKTYGIWFYVDVKPSDVIDLEWKKVK